MNTFNDLTIGGTLPNGATVLAYCQLERDTVILLCNWDGGYVSWKAYHNDLRSTAHGHYYGSDRAKAVEAFGNRLADDLCYVRDNCTSYVTEGESHHA